MKEACAHSGLLPCPDYGVASSGDKLAVAEEFPDDLPGAVRSFRDEQKLTAR